MHKYNIINGIIYQNSMDLIRSLTTLEDFLLLKIEILLALDTLELGGGGTRPLIFLYLLSAVPVGFTRFPPTDSEGFPNVILGWPFAVLPFSAVTRFGSAYFIPGGSFGRFSFTVSLLHIFSLISLILASVRLAKRTLLSFRIRFKFSWLSLSLLEVVEEMPELEPGIPPPFFLEYEFPLF